MDEKVKWPADLFQGDKVTDDKRDQGREGLLDIREAQRAVREGQSAKQAALEASGRVPNKVTALKPKVEPTVSDEIVGALEEMLADIKSGKIIPSHLVLGFGEKTTSEGRPATTYCWDAIGLNTFEVIGHLNSYASRLAMGEGE